MIIYIPIVFPFGTQDWTEISLSIPLNVLRANLTRHSDLELSFKVNLESKPPEFVFSYMKKHMVDKKLTFDQNFIEHYILGSGSVEIQHALKVEISPQITDIISSYANGGDIYKDILFAVSTYFQSLFVLFGPIKIAPVILDDKGDIFFNYKLSYLPQPWQDWFLDKGTINILLDGSIAKDYVNPDEYNLLISYVREFAEAYEFEKLSYFLANSAIQHKNISLLSRTLSDVIRLHPSHDLSLMIGLLTAFIEKGLKIDAELNYRFAIKICNFLNEPKLKPMLKKIYSKRSVFFHSAEYRSVGHIFEFGEIYLLILILKRLVLFTHGRTINSDSFDFPETYVTS